MIGGTMRAATTLAIVISGITIGAAQSSELTQGVQHDWSGFYLGINGGYIWGDVETSANSMTTTGPLVGLPPNTFPNTTFGGPDRSSEVNGGFGGVQAGFNWQSGAFVFGIESDIQGGKIDGTTTFLGSDAGPAYSGETKLRWFGTTRGRIGYAFDRFLPYVTGGVAYGEVTSKLSIQPGTFAAPIGTPYFASNAARLTGYAIGGGIEAAITDNWSARVEYLRIDLGDADAFYDYGSAGSAYAKADFAFDVVRLGLNYSF